MTEQQQTTERTVHQDVADAFAAARRRYVGSPPNVDAVDAAIADALALAETSVSTALDRRLARGEAAVELLRTMPMLAGPEGPDWLRARVEILEAPTHDRLTAQEREMVERSRGQLARPTFRANTPAMGLLADDLLALVDSLAPRAGA